MAVKIRLKRAGKKNRPFWKVVVSDARMPRDGRFIEEIGFYNPLPKKDELVIKNGRLEYWMDKGAQVSTTLKSLIRRSKRQAKAAAK